MINKQLETELKVGLFVSIGIGLVMLAILVLGSTENLMSSQVKFNAYFPAVDGLVSGSKVVLGGYQVGAVEKVDLDLERRMVRVEIGVAKKHREWIRKDSAAEIVTQGVLGDKYISITPGTPEQPELKSGEEILQRPTKDLSQFLNKGDQLMVSLNSIANSIDRLLKSFEAGNRSEIFFQGMATTSKNLSEASTKLNKGLDEGELHATVKNIKGIFEKINNGTGTLGALVNDSGLYDDIKALFGGMNRNRIMRNLVRQTIKKSEEVDAEEIEKAKTAPPRK